MPALKSCGPFNEVLTAMSRLVDNAGSLTLDADNTVSEQFSSVVAKFVGGKRINYSLKRSYETRCLGARSSFVQLSGRLSRRGKHIRRALHHVGYPERTGCQDSHAADDCSGRKRDSMKTMVPKRSVLAWSLKGMRSLQLALCVLL